MTRGNEPVLFWQKTHATIEGFASRHVVEFALISPIQTHATSTFVARIRHVAAPSRETRENWLDEVIEKNTRKMVR